MKKYLFITLSFLFIVSISQAKDVKIIINSNYDKDISVTFMKQGLMTTQVCELKAKKGRNEVSTDKITERGVYSMSYNINDGKYYNNSVLIDPNGDNLIVTFDDKLSISFDGENKNFNTTLLSILNKYQDDARNIHSYKSITEERSKYIYGIYDKMTKDVAVATLSKNEKEMLNGYFQGWLLFNVYSTVSMSKVFGKMNMDLVIEDNHADFMSNIKLLSYVSLYPTWHSYLTEFLYTRINNGSIKIKNSNSWIVDMAKSINDDNLRDEFILETLNREVIMGYAKDIKVRFENSKKLVKSESIASEINLLEEKAAKLTNLNEGKYVGDMIFENVNGESVSLSSFKGKYLFIDMWSTGCNPCIGEIPYMKKIEHSLADKDIAWVSISMDTDINTWKKFMEKNNMKGNQLLCTNGFKHPFCKIIGLRGIPHFILIDKEGKIANSATYRPSNPILAKQLRFITE